MPIDLAVGAVGSIVVDPMNAAVAYVGTQCGVYETSDSGATWARSGAGLPLGLVSALIIDPANGQTLFAGVGPTSINGTIGAGIYKSTDGGATWNPANVGLTSLKVQSLAFGTSLRPTVWAGTQDAGVFASNDGGASWKAVNAGLAFESLFVAAIATTRVDEIDDIVIGTWNGAFALSIQPAPTVDVIEYYNPRLDHYFITATPTEILALDNGTISGWVRTTESFKAYAQAGAGASPVCRFYIPPAKGDSHFYSVVAAECAAIADAANNPAHPQHAIYAGFSLETASAFFMGVPERGECAFGTSPVYRLWNQRADSNHRYTTRPAIRDQMVGRGYALEGVVMCAPQ